MRQIFSKRVFKFLLKENFYNGTLIMFFVTHNLAFKMSNFGPLYLCRSLRQVSNSQKRAPEVSISNKLTKRQPLEKFFMESDSFPVKYKLPSGKITFFRFGKMLGGFRRAVVNTCQRNLSIHEYLSFGLLKVNS